MTAWRIGADTRVTLHFSLSLTDGQEIDSTLSGKPAQFVPGDGSLLPAFEQLLHGLCAGETHCFTVPAEQAFGQRRAENLKRVPRARFPQEMALAPGLVISFAAAEGGELPGVVHRLMGDMVEVDFNHPLAGRDIVFEVDIVAVEPLEEN